MIPRSGEPYKTWNPYDCETQCQDSTGAWKDKDRAIRRCTRLDLDPEPWVPIERVSRTMRSVYTGRSPTRSHGPRWRNPPENPEEGCPGGWQRTPFVASILPYYRRRTEGGGRVQNRLYDTCSDLVVLNAIAYLEAEEDAAVRYQYKKIAEEAAK